MVSSCTERSSSGQEPTHLPCWEEVARRKSSERWADVVLCAGVKFRLGSAGEPTICSHCYSVPYMKIPANNQVLSFRFREDIGFLNKKDDLPVGTIEVTAGASTNNSTFKVGGLHCYRKSLLWRHNERDFVSNHRRLDCLFNRWFRRRWKKTSKPWVTSHCEKNLPVTGWFPSQRASNAEMLPFHDVIMWTTAMAILLWYNLCYKIDDDFASSMRSCLLTSDTNLTTGFMMTPSNGNIFCFTGPLCGELTGHRWSPRTKASDAGLWCFLWSAPE